MIIKTPEMQRLEDRYHRPLEHVLYELYVMQGKSLTDIGREFGVHPTAVLSWLRRCAIKTRRRGRRGGSGVAKIAIFEEEGERNVMRPGPVDSNPSVTAAVEPTSVGATGAH